MKFILGVENILVDSFEVFNKGYFEAKPLPGINIFLRNQLLLDNEIVVICRDLKQKFFINKNFTYIKEENIIIDNSYINQLELVEDLIGRTLDENDKLIDSPPNLAKINDSEIVVAISDNYLFDEYNQDYDFSKYIKIYEEMKNY